MFVFAADGCAAVQSGAVAVSCADPLVQESLQETMQAILRGGSMTQHLEDIERSIWQTYQSLPKNEVGHIGPRAIRYLVHNYFAKEHGWLIKGLEPHGHQQEVSEIHEVSILQDKAPMLVESLLEAQRADRGLSLMDAVAMVATLERLIFDEALLLLHAAYNLNSVETHQALTEQSLHQAGHVDLAFGPGWVKGVRHGAAEYRQALGRPF